MNKICPLISNHEEFLECQGKKCIFFKNECILLTMNSQINYIESNTSGTEHEVNIINKKIKDAN